MEVIYTPVPPLIWPYAYKTGKKAVKHDDAKVPVFLWDGQFIHSCPAEMFPHLDFSDLDDKLKTEWALKAIRDYVFVVYVRRLYCSYRSYMKSKHGIHWSRVSVIRSRYNEALFTDFKRDYEVGRDAIHRASNASWWEWDNGSTLFYWR